MARSPSISKSYRPSLIGALPDEATCRLFEEAGTNAAMVFTGIKGDADAAFRDADYVRRDRFAVQRYTALPMEPRGVLWEGSRANGRKLRHALRVDFGELVGLPTIIAVEIEPAGDITSVNCT